MPRRKSSFSPTSAKRLLRAAGVPTTARGFRSKSGRKRALIFLIAAALLGVLIGIVLPKISPEVGQVTGEYHAVGDAAETLKTLKISDNPRSQKSYDREAFGYQKTDDDGDGCTIREAVLARDLTDIQYKAPGDCKIASGTLEDPYTAKTIHFVRGIKTSVAVQIDHVVALSNAWKSGASTWDAGKLYQYGNDSYNMLAVDGPTNEDKSDASAAYWLPPNASFHCDYVARQIGVKAKYELTVTTAEENAMLKVLHGCPGQKVPTK